MFWEHTEPPLKSLMKKVMICWRFDPLLLSDNHKCVGSIALRLVPGSLVRPTTGPRGLVWWVRASKWSGGDQGNADRASTGKIYMHQQRLTPWGGLSAPVASSVWLLFYSVDLILIHGIYDLGKALNDENLMTTLKDFIVLPVLEWLPTCHIKQESRVLWIIYIKISRTKI